MKNKNFLSRYREAIIDAMIHSLGSEKLPLYTMVRYHLGTSTSEGEALHDLSGKLLRPSLCLLAAEMLGAPVQRAIPSALALELIHNFSLIHDDIQDGDLTRHNRPAVWQVWGMPQAINAGNAALLLAIQSIVSGNAGVLDDKAIMKLTTLLTRITLNLVEGQYHDIAFENESSVSLEAYLAMVGGKTASLISASLQAGAISAGADEEVVALFGNLGESMGVIFQLTDDVLGVWGDPAATGKIKGNDIARMKKTLPVLYMLNQAPSPYREEFSRLYLLSEKNDRDIDRAIEIMEAAGARTWCTGMIGNYSDSSQKIADRLPVDQRSKDELTALVAQFADRTR